MGKLIYTVLASVDGYFEDKDGKFDWAQPNADVHKYINNEERQIQLTFLGRKMYEVMKIWENFPDLYNMPDYIKEYADVWTACKKVVFSRSLTTVETKNTYLKKKIDENEIREIKRNEVGNIGIGGANLASQMLELKLVDEIHIYTFPVLIGSGKKMINNELKIRLNELESVHFDNGVYLIKYRVIID
jgi:dihydrofolate reductase